MTRPQRHFTFALSLFIAWVGALALMAGFSGEPPRSRPTAPVTR